MPTHHYVTLLEVHRQTPKEMFEETRELMIPHIKNIHSMGGLTDKEREDLLKMWEPKYDEFEEIE